MAKGRRKSAIPTNPEMRDLLQKAAAFGTQIEPKQAGWMIKCPDGSMVMIHDTPSDHRAFYNTRSRLRQAGVAL